METGKKRSSVKLSFILAILIVANTVGLISCATLQEDKIVSSADNILESELILLEKLIIPLDTDPDPEKIKKVRNHTSALEQRAVSDAVFSARLAAWSGRLFVIEGNIAEAENRYEKAERLSPGEPSVPVLLSRLTKGSDSQLTLLETAARLNDKPALIILEKALVLYDQTKYLEAVAAFDEALSVLPPFYDDVYLPLRENAWSMREIEEETPAITVELAAKKEIVWSDAIILAQTETVLLDFLTGGSEWSPEDLFPVMRERGLLPPEEVMDITIDSRVVRGAAAWFLWHVNSIYRSEPGLLIMYSSTVYPEAGSPIEDVPVNAAWFDSVLGCVEWEFMALSDGKNFLPWTGISGAEFLHMLGKVE